MVTSTKGPNMDQSEKVRENRLRAMAKRRGRELSKSRRRDPYALDYGRWTIIERDGSERTEPDLDAVEAYLREVPRIEVELCRVGREYRESHGANRDVLGPLVHEANEAGMPLEAVAFVTELPPKDIVALNREATGGE